MAFTFFFRDNHTLEQLVKHLLPTVQGRSNIKIWDAGCAMGPEPYTLAILLAEKMGKFAFKNVRIDASDIDGSDLFGKIIGEGAYSGEELGRIPKEIFEKYFSPVEGNGERYRICEPLRQRVLFRRHDLLTLEPFDQGYSLVLCKNVLLHFAPNQRVDVIRMFHRVLVPGGLLVLEQTQKLPEEVRHLFRQVIGDAQIFSKEEP